MIQSEKPLVSICCIAYNHEKYIQKTIEGFLIQKTSFPVEIIIHDDASTDNTAKIINDYYTKYPNLIKPIIQKKNQYSKGIKPLANFVFPKAIGKYIAICEGDDYWIDPLKLQKQIDFLEHNPNYSMCFHNAFVFEDKRPLKSYLFNIIETSREITFKELISSWIVPTASICFKKEYIMNLPKWTNSSNIISGDVVMTISLINKGKVYYFQDIMSVYLKSFNGCSATARYGNNFCVLTEQLIFIYKNFLPHVSDKNRDELNRKIFELDRELNFYKNKKRSILLAFLTFPALFIKKLLLLINRTYRRLWLS